MAYFDNAATTFPKPQVVYDFMNSFYSKNGGNAGRGTYSESISSAALITETREKLLELFHCPTCQIIFTPTATIALNMIIQGVIKTGAKNIYISPFEHNAVTRTLHSFEKNGLVKVHTLSCDSDFNYDTETIRYDFDNEKPDLVIVSHASNVFGLISPVEELFALGKKYNAVTLVDMAQSAGLVDLSLNNDNFDFAVFAGHKTLYGPTGISGFVMKKQFDLPCTLFGGTGFDSSNQDMPSSLPEKYEMGTQNILGIAGLNASLKWILQTGIETLRKKENDNRQKLIAIFNKYDFVKVVGNKEAQDYAGIVSILLTGIPSDSAANIFAEQKISVRTGLQCAPLAHKFLGTFPTGTIRFSGSWFTNEEDFMQLEKALEYIEDNI